MEIKAGYNDKPLLLIFSANRELWVKQEGLPDEYDRYRETLSYFTLEEAIGLRDELNKVIKEMVGI